MDILFRWTGQDSGTSSEGVTSSGCPTSDGHPFGQVDCMDRSVGQAWSVRIGCAMDVPWMFIGQVDWTGQLDKPGQSGRVVQWMSHGRPLDWTGQWDKPSQ